MPEDFKNPPTEMINASIGFAQPMFSFFDFIFHAAQIPFLL
jgi:hypothetical protein